jgi:hypothetical protein
MFSSNNNAKSYYEFKVGLGNVREMSLRKL